jgi:hypothetical protein
MYEKCYSYWACLKTCHKMFLGIPQPELNKQVTISKGSKVKKFRVITYVQMLVPFKILYKEFKMLTNYRNTSVET